MHLLRASSRGSNCGRLLQARCHLCRVDGDALGAVVCLVNADQAVSKLKPERKWVVSGRMVRNQRSDCEARMRGKYMLLRKEIMMN
jgi:hypothetical protein